MVELPHSFIFDIRSIPPFDFELTVKKPAGWSLFTPFEVYEEGTMWTATDLEGVLAGLKLVSEGTVERPGVGVELFLEESPGPDRLLNMKRMLAHDLGADYDLAAFYHFGKKDPILRHAVEDLKGMHSTSQSTIFPDALLSILLQMTNIKRSSQMMDCLLSRYGELAKFDGKQVFGWPRPERVARLEAAQMAAECKFGYRAKRIANLARRFAREGFPSFEELEKLGAEEAKRLLLELPGIGDYSADIINPHGGFPIDTWSADVFGQLFFGERAKEGKKGIDRIKKEGLRRWGKWSWLAFFYVVQDLGNLSRRLDMDLRLV
jgi:DNA-3-methyladenine glycosylase II